ncbi:MAG: histidine kinase, partial [Phaeodactylibacter sp.]|nr:histidine kinase [Phaeodactylibacter sp.]
NFRIADMTTDDRQRLYIATRGNGVALLDRQQILRQYTTDDGLSSNQCFKLALSGDYLWIATDKGLNRLHLPSGAIQVYNKYDGLPSNEILEVAQLGQHRIVIGTTKGVAVFPDTLNPTHDLAPLVHIEGIRVNDQQVKSSALQQLSHRQNNLEFQYIALHFRSRGKVSYFYRVEGLQEEWVRTDSRSLRFNALPPGSYTFYVYSKTEDGVRSAEATSVSFHIATPFWQEWWFVLALALVLIGLTWLFVTIRFRQIRKKEMVERSLRERINELRTRALQTQMNPHFVFNALNTVQHSISANDPERAMVTLSKFAQLIRMIFEQSKEKLIALDRELEFLKLYLDFEQMRQGDRVAISFEIDPELRAEASVIKLPPLLIQPVIENAFKHGLLDKETDGLVRISFEKRSDLVQCTIEDNGVGRAYSVQKKEQSANTKHTPSGLKTTAERLALLHNSDAKSSSYLKVTDLYDATGQGAGTKVTLQIPIHKA